MAEISETRTVTLASLERLTTVNLRGRADDEALEAVVREISGTGLPAPNRIERGSRGSVIWLGPDEWLLVLTEGRAARIEADLRARLGDDPWLSLVDHSHHYTGFELAGPRARSVLAKGCTLDLHPAVFGRDDCAQTLLAGSRMLLCCIGDDEFEIRVRNSFAHYAAAWLTDAMREYTD